MYRRLRTSPRVRRRTSSARRAEQDVSHAVSGGGCTCTTTREGDVIVAIAGVATGAHRRIGALSTDALAHVDRTNPRTVRFVDAPGYTIGVDVVHPLEVTVVRLNQTGSTVDRRWRLWIKPDLHVATMLTGATRKFTSRWTGAVERLLDMLARRRTRNSVWYYPDAAFVDRISPQTKLVREGDFGMPRRDFDGKRNAVRRVDGAVIHGRSAHVPTLYQHVLANQWDRAIRLCRFSRTTPWSCWRRWRWWRRIRRRRDRLRHYRGGGEGAVHRDQKSAHEEGRSAELALFR